MAKRKRSPEPATIEIVSTVNSSSSIRFQRTWESTLFPFCITKKLNGLRYFKHKSGSTKRATLKEFKDENDVLTACNLLKHHDSQFVLQPERHLIRKTVHYLVFPLVVTNFKYYLEKYITKELTWSDEEAFGIFRDIGKAVQYLFNTDRDSHSDLLNGICITAKNDVFLWNFVKGSTKSFHKDIEDLNQILKGVIGNVKDEGIHGRLKSFHDFLKSTTSYEEAGLNMNKRYRSDYKHFVEAFMLNHPIFWDPNQSLQFLSNMYRLGRGPHRKLTKCPSFEDKIGGSKSLGKWMDIVNTHVVLQAVKENRRYKRSGDIILFAHNCIKHYAETAYELSLDAQLSDDGKVFLDEQAKFLPHQVLGVLLEYFPLLLEELYETFFRMLACDKYCPPYFHPHQILKEKVN